VNLFGIVSFVHDVEVGMPGPVTLSEEFAGMTDIVDRVLGDLQTGDDVTVGIDRDGRYQELFSRLTGSPGIIVAGI
jgi:hypothetical protein